MIPSSHELVPATVGHHPILTKNFATVSRMLQASIVPSPASKWVTTVIEATIALGVARHFPTIKLIRLEPKLNEKVYRDGSVESLQSSRRAIEGHLLPVSAGYLLDAHFLYYYIIDPQYGRLTRHSTMIVRFGSALCHWCGRV
jgi:hypothetical protein